MLTSCLRSSPSIPPLSHTFPTEYPFKKNPRLFHHSNSISPESLWRMRDWMKGLHGKKKEKPGHNWPEKNRGIVSQQFTVVNIHYCLCNQRKPSFSSSQDHFRQKKKNKVFICQDQSLPWDSRYINPENSIWFWVQPLAILTMLAQTVTDTWKINQKYSSKKWVRWKSHPAWINLPFWKALSQSPRSRQLARTGIQPKRAEDKDHVGEQAKGCRVLTSILLNTKSNKLICGKILRNSSCQFVHPPTPILSCLLTATPDY